MYAKEQLHTHGYVVVPAFLGPAEREYLQGVWERAARQAVRRDVTIGYAGITSQRRLVTLSAEDVAEHSDWPERLYTDPELLRWLSAAADTEVVPLADRLERYVVNALVAEGDHHGAHRDSFPFACSIPICQPADEGGGRLQIGRPAAPDELHDVECSAGDLVFFRSGRLTHRVTPLRTSSPRLVLNMAYATPDTSTVASNSRDQLYGANGSGRV
jgi:ectoine hydroxylase-related dioxygenase (phytanoyl-CoA dioxygenase family)